jgi:hypothetical protein
MTYTQKTVQLVGIKTDRFTQEQRRVECELELRKTEKFGWIVIVSKGSVTGLEYFSAAKSSMMFKGGWNACAGTRLEYDGLFFSESEMLRALTALGLENKK